MNIKITNLLSSNNGKLPSYTENGDYPLFYVLRGGKVLCPKCANKLLIGGGLNNISANDLEDYQVNWDSTDLKCINDHYIERATIEFSEKGVIDED